MSDDDVIDPDRAAILARRKHFIAMALSGLATTACTDGQGHDDKGGKVEGPVAPESEPASEPEPRPCLKVAAPDPEPQPEPLPAPENDPATQQYRAALSALSERRLPDAISAFDRFVREHPAHPYADNAMYWRAEIDYTRRDYAGALARFSALIERFPHGNKVPDALLRIGLCYERMGQRERARRVFSRLRQQYPDTVAARMASREDA